MAEYIEREPLLAEYDREHEGPPGRARELIANAPSADVAPVRHGYWVYKLVRGDDMPCCSECGISTGSLYEYYYCPNCGAKMEASNG